MNAVVETNVSVEQIKSALEENHSVLVSGEKPYEVRASILACQQLELDFAHVGSLIDPEFLIGIPTPEDGKYVMLNLRISNAEVLVFDLLHRAHPYVLDIIADLAKADSVDKTKFPNLKHVIGIEHPEMKGYVNGAYKNFYKSFDSYVELTA